MKNVLVVAGLFAVGMIIYIVYIEFLTDIAIGWRAYKRGDYETALEYYVKACYGGESVACSNLGHMYKDGTGVKLNKQMALDYFGKACEMKNLYACEHYAELKKELGQ